MLLYPEISCLDNLWSHFCRFCQISCFFIFAFLSFLLLHTSYSEFSVFSYILLFFKQTVPFVDSSVSVIWASTVELRIYILYLDGCHFPLNFLTFDYITFYLLTWNMHHHPYTFLIWKLQRSKRLFSGMGFCCLLWSRQSSFGWDAFLTAVSLSMPVWFLCVFSVGLLFSGCLT